MLALQSAPHPVDEKMRVLDLQVTGADGEVRLTLPWDQTAHDLGPVLVARRTVLDDRKVAAYHAAPDGPVDLLGIPLGKALRSAENPGGADAIVIEVETGDGALAFTVRCADVGEPLPHVAYPRGADDQGRRLVDAYKSAEGSDWFCDGSSTLSCCDAARARPEHQDWVAF